MSDSDRIPDVYKCENDYPHSYTVDKTTYDALKNDPAFEPMSTTEFIPYPTHIKLPESKPDVDSWLEVGKLVLRNFQMHERTQYVEFIFLCIGIVYFLEAIVKNTLEMLHHG